MGWVEDIFFVFGFVSIIIVSSFVFAFGLIIRRYNLVKVQLDEVGEGLFRDIDSPVLLLSNENSILRANPKAQESFSLEQLMESPEQERQVEKLIPDFKEENSNFDTILNTRVGSREYECTLSNVYQMDEVLGSIVVFHDVTKERELARMKTEFTSTVSHELRTPLTSILGFAKLIEKRFTDIILPKWNAETKKEQRAVKQINKNLNVIISESNRLTKLINDVLDISKMEAGKVDWNFVKCDAKDIIEQAINATSGLFASKAHLNFIQNIPANLPEVVADSDRVVQVIINLISNAVKFTDRGSITVQVEKGWSSLTIKVSDTGDGISPENQKLVFQKYKQVGDVITDKPTGTGLGLPISREIVEKHGGKIWVESTPGSGSTFAFTLPLANVIDNHLPNIAITDMVSQLNNLGNRQSIEEPTILVIDDEAPIREVLRQMIEEKNYTVLEAADGMEGLTVIRQEPPDLIILDVMMPRLNGFDCAAAIKADPELRHIPIMMLTVVENAQRAYGLGVEAYLTKPFRPEEVMSQIERLLQKQSRQQRVVLLGQSEESLAVWKQLQKTTTDCLQVENINGLKEALEQQGPDLAIVVGGSFQEEQSRLEIQRLVGANSCLVLYINSNPH